MYKFSLQHFFFLIYVLQDQDVDSCFGYSINYIMVLEGNLEVSMDHYIYLTTWDYISFQELQNI